MPNREGFKQYPQITQIGVRYASACRFTIGLSLPNLRRQAEAYRTL